MKTAEEYETIARKFYLRYVNYAMFIEGLVGGKSLSEVGDFEKRPVLTEKPENEEDEENVSCCCCLLPSFWSKEKEEKEEKGKEATVKGSNTERESDADTERKRFAIQAP